MSKKYDFDIPAEIEILARKIEICGNLPYKTKLFEEESKEVYGLIEKYLSSYLHSSEIIILEKIIDKNTIFPPKKTINILKKAYSNALEHEFTDFKKNFVSFKKSFDYIDSISSSTDINTSRSLYVEFMNKKTLDYLEKLDTTDLNLLKRISLYGKSLFKVRPYLHIFEKRITELEHLEFYRRVNATKTKKDARKLMYNIDTSSTRYRYALDNYILYCDAEAEEDIDSVNTLEEIKKRLSEYITHSHGWNLFYEKKKLILKKEAEVKVKQVKNIGDILNLMNSVPANSEAYFIYEGKFRELNSA